MASGARRLSPKALGLIAFVVPASFYIGTILNKHNAGLENEAHTVATPLDIPTSDTAQTSSSRSRPEAPDRPVVSSGISDAAILQARIKGLKTNKFALENEVKDNEEKLKRLEERAQRKREGLAS